MNKLIYNKLLRGSVTGNALNCNEEDIGSRPILSTGANNV